MGDDYALGNPIQLSISADGDNVLDNLLRWTAGDTSDIEAEEPTLAGNRQLLFAGRPAREYPELPQAPTFYNNPDGEGLLVTDRATNQPDALLVQAQTRNASTLTIPSAGLIQKLAMPHWMRTTSRKSRRQEPQPLWFAKALNGDLISARNFSRLNKDNPKN